MFRHVTSCYSLTIINKDAFSRAWPPRTLSPFGWLVVLHLLLIETFLIVLKRLCCAILSVVRSCSWQDDIIKLLWSWQAITKHRVWQFCRQTFYYRLVVYVNREWKAPRGVTIKDLHIYTMVEDSLRCACCCFSLSLF